MEGNERARQGLELPELFIGNNICGPFLLVVDQWRIYGRGSPLLGGHWLWGQQYLPRMGDSPPFPWAFGTETPTPGTATGISLVVGQSQAWPCLGEAQEQKGRMVHVGGVTSDPPSST